MPSDWRALSVRLSLIARALGTSFTVCAIFFAPATHSAGVEATVVVSNAWIRWLPANLPAAGYAILRNVGDSPATLVGASTFDYGAVMFHESRNQHGIEQMLPADSIQIKPHSQVSFAPQSYHIMLMQPTRSIQPGDHILLTLHFGDGQSLKVIFEVRNADGSAAKRSTASNRG